MKEIRKLILKDENDVGKWESKVSDYSLEDIDEKMLKEFIEKGRKAKRINYPYTNKKEILKKLSLVNKKNELLNAGYILFAKESKLEMQMAIFATESKLTFLDIDQVFGNIFELIEIGETYIRKNIKWPVNFKSGSMERVEIPEIPLEAIREALINSLIHRDFKNPKSNEIAIYKDRIEIFNPGEFPEGYKPEDFIEGKEGSMPRNPLIANTLYLSKDIEKWGSGFKRITEECKAENVKVEFKIKKSGFTVIFYRKSDKELLDLTEENKSTQENTQETHKKRARNAQEDFILDFCNEARSLKEILEYCGYKNARSFREKYINPLLKNEKLKMTIPNQPKNRNQKYIKNNQQD